MTVITLFILEFHNMHNSIIFVSSYVVAYLALKFYEVVIVLIKLFISSVGNIQSAYIATLSPFNLPTLIFTVYNNMWVAMYACVFLTTSAQHFIRNFEVLATT